MSTKFFNWQNKFQELKFQKEENAIIKAWIENGIDEDTIKYAEKFGTYLAQKDDTAEDQEDQTVENKINEDKQTKKEEKKIELKTLSSSQLRKFFGAIKGLQNKILLEQNEDLKDEHIRELLMLKPKLAYAVARAKSDYAKIHNFYDVIVTCIDNVKTKQHFKNFISLLEAIVAYHKVEEEKNSK
ncbi:MAG TPA: type III-A CRISPR-associated protein Csm2 [Bacteroidales bacterium]|nr:type III-A CRISPR-associated protein Csm2 [Bacteroidales bacterium]HOK98996.1 type III-A CRISPR-associated protein Csm2 [Bacteroidales bacterium]HPO65440.1 type III-A CRISPR-associated protein Csm2 [Bacteroidales bacterium]